MARTKVRQFKANPHGKPSPTPLENCPWCGRRFGPSAFSPRPNDDYPRELRIVCTNFECDFSRERPLPVVAVDEPIYRRLPAFLIATVDKFASLPWVGESGVLLSGADRFDTNGFYGAAETGLRWQDVRRCHRGRQWGTGYDTMQTIRRALANWRQLTSVLE